MGITKPPLSPDSEITFPEFVLLNASAGAGKTFQLSLRFVQFLLSDVIASKMKEPGSEAASGLRNLLAITFTKNAAREMKVRILGWLKKAALGDADTLDDLRKVISAPPEEIRKKAYGAVEDIIEGYSDLRVDTIDSFMSEVFRASTLDLGISPDYEISLEGSEILDYAFQRYLRRVGPGTPEGDRFLEITGDVMSFVREEGAFVWDPAALIGEKLAALTGKLAARTLPPDLTDHRLAMAPLEKKIKALVGRIAGSIEAAGLELNSQCHFGKWMRDAAARGHFVKFLDASFKSFPIKKPKREAPPECGAIERDWPELEAAVQAYRGCFARGFFLPYLEAHAEMVRTLADVKARRGIVLLEDVYAQLHRLLDRGEVPEIFFRLGDQIFHYLIDEFQDTSPIQWAVLKPLIENSLGGKGSLLLVGDTKQAIYGFRNADFEIQANIVKQAGSFEPFASAKTVVKPMAENHRSCGRVLEFVKAVFKGNLARSDKYGEAARLSGLTEFEQEVPAARRASGCAEYAEIVRDDESWPEKKEVQERVLGLLRRGFRFRDIGILTLKNESVVRVASWLNEIEFEGRSVPFIPFSSLDIRKRKVTGEILSLLKFLDAPPDDLAFAAFLQSDLLAERLVHDPEEPVSGRAEWADRVRRFLFERRTERRGGPAYTDFRSAFPSVWKKYLEPHFKAVGYFPLYDLVTEIYRGFDVFKHFGPEEAALAKFLEAIKDFEGMGKNDLGAFLSEAESDERKESKLDIDVPVDIDAVRIMSIHKAKGLGFPAVILLLYGERFQAPEFYLSDKDGLVRVLRLNETLAEADDDLEEVYESARDRDRVDRLNTLYVGLTRAKQELHVLGVRRDGESYPFDLFEGLGVKPLGEKGPNLETESADDAGPEPRLVRFGDADIVERSFTPKGVLSDRRVLRGIHAHAILAGIEFVRSSWGEEVRRAIDTLVIPESERSLAEESGAAIAAFFKGSELSDLFAERPGRLVLTEFEVCDASGNVLRIDRAVVDPGAAVVLDFKTGEDQAGGERAAGDRAQMETYLRIMKQVHPEREVTGILVYIDQGRWDRLS